jgi:hypothetical protein
LGLIEQKHKKKHIATNIFLADKKTQNYLGVHSTIDKNIF